MDDMQMSDLTQAVYDTLPEPVQANFELSGDVFVTKDSLKIGGLNESLAALTSERDNFKNQIGEASVLEAEKIALAKKQGWDDAVNSGDLTEQARILEEQRKDAETRTDLATQELTTIRESIAGDKKNVIVSEIGLLATPESKFFIEMAVSARTKVDPITGGKTFFNADGTASSLDQAGFIESLKNDPVFKPHLLGSLSTSNGNLGDGNNGNDGGEGKVNKSAEEAKKSGDSIGFLNAKFKEVLKR